MRRRSPSVACPVAGRSYASAVSPARSERVREAMCQTDLTWPITSPLPVPVAFDVSVSTASGSNSVSGQESTAVQTERSGAEQTPLPPVAAATSVVSSAPLLHFHLRCHHPLVLPRLSLLQLFLLRAQLLRPLLVLEPPGTRADRALRPLKRSSSHSANRTTTDPRGRTRETSNNGQAIAADLRKWRRTPVLKSTIPSEC